MTTNPRTITPLRLVEKEPQNTQYNDETGKWEPAQEITSQCLICHIVLIASCIALVVLLGVFVVGVVL